MCGSTEAHALASKPIRYVLGDERDRWALSAGNEGDPWDLGDGAADDILQREKWRGVHAHRQKRQRHRGSLRDRHDGAVEIPAALIAASITRSNGADIRFEHDEIIIAGKKTYKVRSVCYACPGCGCISTEAEMKRAPARWRQDNPAAYDRARARSG